MSSWQILIRDWRCLWNTLCASMLNRSLPWRPRGCSETGRDLAYLGIAAVAVEDRPAVLLAVAQGIAAVFQCCRLELVSGWCGYPRFQLAALVDLFLELVMVLLLLLVVLVLLMAVLHCT